MTKTKFIVGVLLAFFIGGALIYTLVSRPQAPASSFTTLKGEKIALADLRGKVVLVNFWATWCTTCVQEMPKMVDTYRKFAPRGYEMVAVAVQSDHPNNVAAFTQKRALPFKVDPRVLIPRPETEGLVERALVCTEDNPAPKVLDVGTGTGAIALAFKFARPRASVWATDTDPQAVALARENAARLNLDLEVRVDVRAELLLERARLGRGLAGQDAHASAGLRLHQDAGGR